MMNFIRLFLILVFLPFAKAETKIETVICSFSILKDLCAQLCQGIDTIEVKTIVENWFDPHMYQPKPSDSKLLAGADLVIINGLNLEGWINDYIKASGYKGQIVIASKNVTTRYLGKFPDPHIWHNPELVIKMIDEITHGLKQKFSKYSKKFESNAISLKSSFNILDQNIKQLFSTIAEGDRIMLTSHDAFSYFGERYNIKVLSPQGVSTSDDPSAHDMKNLINQIRTLSVSAIFIEKLSNPKILQAIADETKIDVQGELYADTLKEGLNLQDTLWYNATTIAGAMGKKTKDA